MSQDSRVLSRAFLGIGLILILISAVTFRPTPDYTLIFNSTIGSDFYEESEGDRVNVYYPPGHPEEAEINNPWVNFFKWGFVGIAGIIFSGIGLIIRVPSAKILPFYLYQKRHSY
ncbi:DUF3592 domain-containing protein [Escherichia albertii]|uniref:DUF3592 domain-containing protein n=1 Tax=Escherichia albertii TaxID=208962 RepID=UPI00211A420A|nr:DUF3592 domain-containing protein [Escherichia albertii]UUL17153.1 DUF3592 domain-containing protein [Escherichia albertii]